MNGTAHMTVGAAVGFIIAQTYGADAVDTASLVAAGGVSALIPDLDVNGKLSNKVTFSSKMVRSAVQVVSLLVMLYSYLEGSGNERWLGIGYGVLILIFSTFITQRRMLTITGIGIAACGFQLDTSWMWLMGIYVIIASLVSHRTYTHSILGIIYFYFVALAFQGAVMVDGLFQAAMIGYISHLIGDMKFLPFNKKGVKLFLPLSSKEI